MLVSTQMIYNELQDVKKILKQIINKELSNSIEEVSLNKAAKLLNLGASSVISLVERGRLKARVYRDSNRKKRFRFRLADIREFQESKTYNPINYETVEVERAEDIAKRVFNLWTQPISIYSDWALKKCKK